MKLNRTAKLKIRLADAVDDCGTALVILLEGGGKGILRLAHPGAGAPEVIEGEAHVQPAIVCPVIVGGSAVAVVVAGGTGMPDGGGEGRKVAGLRIRKRNAGLLHGQRGLEHRRAALQRNLLKLGEGENRASLDSSVNGGHGVFAWKPRHFITLDFPCLTDCCAPWKENDA